MHLCASCNDENKEKIGSVINHKRERNELEERSKNEIIHEWNNVKWHGKKKERLF
jgi:hypothetical protein